MLPGIGIFGSDPVSKILIEILKHFDFDIHAVWTNSYDGEIKRLIKTSECSNLVTNSIDNVLLNKNVNLIFVCCQPNLHSQISTKALGIGKNVICLFPTCKNIDEIEHMIVSARYYPCLMSSIFYGGLKYLSEYKLIKKNLCLIGDIKVCNISISCQSLVMARSKMYNRLKDEKQDLDCLSTLIDKIILASCSTSSSESINWLGDKDLGAGVLNRYGASIISLILNLFENKKVTKVFGCLRTLIENFDQFNSQHFSIRKITADDHCTFQLNLEPGSILVNFTVNSLAHSKYSQEINLCGDKGVLTWINSKIIFKSLSAEQLKMARNLVDSNNNVSNLRDSNSDEVDLSDSVDEIDNEFLDKYKDIENKYPELPYLYVRGLYFYLQNIKEELIELNKFKSDSKKSNTIQFNAKKNLENFEHTRLIQLIVKKICQSSNENRWVPVNY
ncbi:unnamed protein product [Brachionus calyciflorus]|uniref:Uncharacterized protein n=1 Tax=Brachionus calyciflorus TaxID=104777 RepID=A0A813NDY1_9BILA|nr:unnamed protein product [Brachionus calyciflorus]